MNISDKNIDGGKPFDRGGISEDYAAMAKLKLKQSEGLE